MKTKQILLAALLAALVVPAMAEEGGDPAQEVRREVRERVAHPGHHYAYSVDGSMDIMPFGGPGVRVHSKPIKNAPYSADLVTERQQTLADGNQISTKHTGTIARDSEGRTRQEIRSEDGKLRNVIIQSDKVTMHLRPGENTGTRIDHEGLARRMAEARVAGVKAGEKAREKIEILRKEGKLARAEGNDAREAVIVRRMERAEERADAGRERAEEVQVRVEKRVEERVEQMRRLAPMIARAAADGSFARNATTKDLGTRDIEGVRAEGKLTSYEIPAGEMGNARPIVVSDETWFSPELQVTVYSKHSDPRSGDRIYRLDNIRRAEPPKELFDAPAGYAIREPGMAKKADKEKK